MNREIILILLVIIELALIYGAIKWELTSKRGLDLRDNYVDLRYVILHNKIRYTRYSITTYLPPLYIVL